MYFELIISLIPATFAG
ncbi:MAG: hypothetical protein KDC80_30325 [Saprospiraceae bacterium]|nr:hypothetical protein [Saprospiraceae bacterium]